MLFMTLYQLFITFLFQVDSHLPVHISGFAVTCEQGDPLVYKVQHNPHLNNSSQNNGNRVWSVYVLDCWICASLILHIIKAVS